MTPESLALTMHVCVCCSQQPQPLSVEPRQGPQAGGTTLTINGTHLDTGSKEDVRVTLNDVPCEVYVSPMAAEPAWLWGEGGKT